LSRISDFRFQISDFRFQISDFRFQILGQDQNFSNLSFLKLGRLFMNFGVVNPRKNAGKGTAKTPRSQRGRREEKSL
jgi:hypothetical protein